MQTEKPYPKDAYHNYVSMVRHLKETYPEHFHYQVVGYSLFHHPIILIQLGNGNKRLLMTGGVHGRESINPFALLKMIEYYLMHWHEYQYYFKAHTLFWVPLLNPDSLLLAEQYSDWKDNGRHVDINRNFPCSTWKPKFQHDMPESEPETELLITLFETIMPSVYLDFHSRGEGIYYYRNSMDEQYNQMQYNIAKQLHDITGYELYQPEEEIQEGDSGGNTVQYFAETYHLPAFTIETIPDSAAFPLSAEYCQQVFEEIYQIPFLF